MQKTKKTITVIGIILGILIVLALSIILFNALEKLPDAANFDFYAVSDSEILYGDELEVKCFLKTNKFGIFWIRTGNSIFSYQIDNEEHFIPSVANLGPMKHDLSENIKIPHIEKGRHKITINARFSLSKYRNSNDWQDYSYSKTFYVEVK